MCTFVCLAVCLYYAWLLLFYIQSALSSFIIIVHCVFSLHNNENPIFIYFVTMFAIFYCSCCVVSKPKCAYTHTAVAYTTPHPTRNHLSIFISILRYLHLSCLLASLQNGRSSVVDYWGFKYFVQGKLDTLGSTRSSTISGKPKNTNESKIAKRFKPTSTFGNREREQSIVLLYWRSILCILLLAVNVLLLFQLLQYFQVIYLIEFLLSSALLYSTAKWNYKYCTSFQFGILFI